MLEGACVHALRNHLRPSRLVSAVSDVVALVFCAVSAAMGQKPTEEELFQMISEVDDNMSGSIDFGEFLKVIEKQKERAAKFDDESDMIDAFVACGGQADKGGHVHRDTLVKIIKHDFGLTIDIAQLINEIDEDRSGQIEYEEFKALLS